MVARSRRARFVSGHPVRGRAVRRTSLRAVASTVASGSSSEEFGRSRGLRLVHRSLASTSTCPWEIEERSALIEKLLCSSDVDDALLPVRRTPPDGRGVEPASSGSTMRPRSLTIVSSGLRRGRAHCPTPDLDHPERCGAVCTSDPGGLPRGRPAPPRSHGALISLPVIPSLRRMRGRRRGSPRGRAGCLRSAAARARARRRLRRRAPGLPRAPARGAACSARPGRSR